MALGHRCANRRIGSPTGIADRSTLESARSMAPHTRLWRVMLAIRAK